MNVLLRPGIAVGVFLVVMGQNSFAREGLSGDTAFDTIKARMISAARDNRQLTAEYKSLKDKLAGLRMENARLKNDLEALESQETRQPMGDIADDVLIREAQEIYTTGRSMNMDGRARLKELFLYDLSFQKQESRLDWQVKRRLSQEEWSRRQKELGVIQKDIEEGLAQEKRLLNEIAELEKGILTSSRDKGLLETDGKRFQEDTGGPRPLF
jgi:hypothetical protein